MMLPGDMIQKLEAVVEMVVDKLLWLEEVVVAKEVDKLLWLGEVAVSMVVEKLLLVEVVAEEGKGAVEAEKEEIFHNCSQSQ